MAGNKLGIMIIGVGGAVATTVNAGLALMRRGLATPAGLTTESEHMPVGDHFDERGETPLIREALSLAQLSDIFVGGWETRGETLVEACQRHRVVHRDLLPPVTGDLGETPVFGGLVRASDGSLVKVRGDARTVLAGARAAVDSLRADIEQFRAATGVAKVIIVNLAPTAIHPNPSPAHDDLAALERALDGDASELTSEMLYLYAACQTADCAWLNFTPNVVEVASLEALANKTQTPLAGRDGKTGQTFLKTVLAPALRARQLKVRGWFSTNILGNADGASLADPKACETKIQSKASALESILGYQVGTEDASSHVVTIHYYPPRGDAKEAWDNIDVEGFLGAYMNLKLNFLCKDSILAAPLVIDMARLLELSLRRKQGGLAEHLSSFFKSPLSPKGVAAQHNFFEQRRDLAAFLTECADASDG
jgi:myo-inositol-1-phosphate synthase